MWTAASRTTDANTTTAVAPRATFCTTVVTRLASRLTGAILSFGPTAPMSIIDVRSGLRRVRRAVVSGGRVEDRVVDAFDRLGHVRHRAAVARDRRQRLRSRVEREHALHPVRPGCSG